MTTPPAARTIDNAAAQVETRIGTQRLSRDDMLILACRELVHTFTRDEVGYRAEPGSVRQGPA